LGQKEQTHGKMSPTGDQQATEQPDTIYC